MSTFKDAFNLLCGAKLGEGISRTVFEHRLDKRYVVKVEDNPMKVWANIKEWMFWQEYGHRDDISKWLAPCLDISENGRVLIQQRALLIQDKSEVPDTLPRFLTDVKYDNFGWIVEEGCRRLVCVDYAMVYVHPSSKLQTVFWV